MVVENLLHNDGGYALALQFGDYRAATREAIRAIRRLRRAGQADAPWDMRLRGAFARRNRGSA